VHGAIAGWYGQVATQFPGDSTVQTIYCNAGNAGGMTSEQGTLSCTPALIASLQVAEVCKIILETGQLLRDRWLCADLLEMEFHAIRVAKPLADTCG